MAIRKRGRTFQVDVVFEGKRARKSAKTKDEANKLEKELLTKLMTGEIGGDPKKVSEKTLGDLYIITKNLYWKGTKAEKALCQNAEIVLNCLGSSTPASEVKSEDIAEMIFSFEKKGNSNATINRKLSALSKLLSVAHERDYIDKAPKIPYRKENHHRIRWLTEAEELTLLGFLDHMGLVSLKDFFVVAVDTGFRVSELLKFDLKDYQGGLMHIWDTKNGHPRAVPATDRVKVIIEDRIERGFKRPFEDISKHDLRYGWGLVRKHMKMENDDQFVIHALRHTCASRLVQRGIPLAVVQKWMGHRAIQTTLRYAHLAPENLAAAMQVLNTPKPGHLSLVSQT